MDEVSCQDMHAVSDGDFIAIGSVTMVLALSNSTMWEVTASMPCAEFEWGLVLPYEPPVQIIACAEWA